MRPMRSSKVYDRLTADRIKVLLARTRNARRADQKRIRDQIRDLGFYISEFPPRPASGFTPEDFDQLIRDGRIRVK